MVPEARLEDTEAGLVPAGEGWFVLNARDARWNQRPGLQGLTFTGSTDFEAETYFPQLGVNLFVLELSRVSTERALGLVHRERRRTPLRRQPRSGHAGVGDRVRARPGLGADALPRRPASRVVRPSVTSEST